MPLHITTIQYINDTDKALIASEQMAIDKQLFNSFAINDTPILRLYRWQPSFTVGISQHINDYETLYPPYKGAKRITGGGVLFHGSDISYTLLLPTPLLKAYSVKESYEIICAFLLQFYINLGLTPQFAKDNPHTILTKSPFCQVGFEAYDILIGDKKIGGNAQRRNKKLILQHGSINLTPNQWFAHSGYALSDFGIKLSWQQATTKLKEAFDEVFIM